MKHRSNPLQRQVLRSTDGGATWSRIEVEQPDASFLDLAGVSDGGIVAGLFHDGLMGGGDLSVVLEDGRLAFRRPTRQEERGDLERGRLFLWRPLSPWERIQRMGL